MRLIITMASTKFFAASAWPLLGRAFVLLLTAAAVNINLNHIIKGSRLSRTRSN